MSEEGPTKGRRWLVYPHTQDTDHNGLEQTLGWKKYLIAETNTAKTRTRSVFDFDKMKIFDWELFV